MAGASVGHTPAAMSATRTGAARAALAVVALVAGACSGPAGSSAPLPTTSEPAPAPSAAPSTLPAPAPGVSWLRVTPPQGSPGSRVSLDVACLDELGPVSSPALDVGPLAPDPQGHQPWRLTGAGTVRPGTAPGRYPVSATCGSQRLSATFTVVARR
jgi:hypothetical protein